MSATELYRYYDEAGTLLYVGISKYWPGRDAQHKQGSEWRRQVSTVRIEQFDSRAEALAAESAAIAAERPAFNVAMAGSYRKPRKRQPKPEYGRPTEPALARVWEARRAFEKANADWLAEIVHGVEHDGRAIADVARVAGISRTQVRRLLAQAVAA